MRRSLIALMLAAGFAAAAAAQSGATKPTPPEQQPPVFRSEANFVRVDVYPMIGGKPVQDLRALDFEILEDGVVQSIQSFEHVVIRPAGPQSLRVEPNTIEAANQLAANPRNRVFVLFLDVPHVSVEGTWHVREPLVKLIDKILGPDDLVGVMTPSMAAADVVLARKTSVLEGGLLNIWPWGERHTLAKDEREYLYEACYPTTEAEVRAGKFVSDLSRNLTQRRRERATLDALHDLVYYLHGIRQERKAILTVSEGWVLFRPDKTLYDLRINSSTGEQDPIPGVDPITVGPDGRLTTKSTRNNTTGIPKSLCDSDRIKLADMDNDLYLRDIIGEANRSNASFYTVDPRGLAVFDSPIGPERPPNVIVDAAILRTRLEALRTLAGATDGLAVMNSNDLNAGLQRIADDLTSYYLLGYYSTNGKLDGKFRNIKVRVKRPGVEVRARKGYRAATEKEVTSAKKASDAPVPDIVSTVTSALGLLDRVRPGTRFHVNAVPSSARGSTSVSIVWVAGELRPTPGADPWANGGTADVDVSAPGVSGTARATLAPGERGFVVPVTLSKPVASGQIDVRVRLSGGDSAAERAVDSLAIEPALALGRPLMFRRGPGNRQQPVATGQFSRTERVRLEALIAPDLTPGPARLLDKAGQPLVIPVTVAQRTDDQTGERWLTADVTLAALAPGDYAIELTGTTPAGQQRVVAAIRVSR